MYTAKDFRQKEDLKQRRDNSMKFNSQLTRSTFFSQQLELTYAIQQTTAPFIGKFLKCLLTRRKKTALLFDDPVEIEIKLLQKKISEKSHPIKKNTKLFLFFTFFFIYLFFYVYKFLNYIIFLPLAIEPQKKVIILNKVKCELQQLHVSN